MIIVTSLRALLFPHRLSGAAAVPSLHELRVFVTGGGDSHRWCSHSAVPFPAL